jgi:hypothetical protein
MLEIGVAQDTVSDTFANERTNAVLGDLLKRGISPFAELLKRAPGRSRNKGQGGRAGKRGGHGETSTERIAQRQRYSNDTVVLALSRFGAEIMGGWNPEGHLQQNYRLSRHCWSVLQPKSNPKHQCLEPIYSYLAHFNSTNHAV